MQARPGEAGGLISGAKMGAEVVRVPALALRAGEVPVAFAGTGEVVVKITARGRADWYGAVTLGFRFPVYAVDFLGPDADHAVWACVKVNVVRLQPQCFFAP